jgi:hypothetical protein
MGAASNLDYATKAIHRILLRAREKNPTVKKFGCFL